MCKPDDSQTCTPGANNTLYVNTKKEEEEEEEGKGSRAACTSTWQGKETQVSMRLKKGKARAVAHSAFIEHFRIIPKQADIKLLEQLGSGILRLTWKGKT